MVRELCYAIGRWTVQTACNAWHSPLNEHRANILCADLVVHNLISLTQEASNGAEWL
jgi:hypothetical protein